MGDRDASEAHKPHEDDLRHWLRGFHADATTTFALIPSVIYKLLVDMGYLDGTSLTQAGYQEIGG